MVQQGLQDADGMLEYARQRLPPLPKKGEEEKEPPKLVGGELVETRQMWVDRMLDRARAILLGLEMGLEESFLDLDKENKGTVENVDTSNSTTVEEKKESNASEDDEEDAWQ